MMTAMRTIARICLIVGLLADAGAAWCQEEGNAVQPTLARAVMCESIEAYAPVNPAVVFSIERGRIFCFTEFDPVPRKTFIHHRWYRRDSLITAKRLTINPPRWSSFTSVQLRDADKGPWRVEVVDEKGILMHTLRFSITD
jgi:hypothetical protein